MKNQISSKITALVFSVLVVCFAIALYAFAWTEPSESPPGGNVEEPINVSGEPQVKAGGIILNTGGAPNGLLVEYGNVGIGTTTPQYKLAVAGDVQLSETICSGGEVLSTDGNGKIECVSGGLGISECVRRTSDTGPSTELTATCPDGYFATGGSCYTSFPDHLEGATVSWNCRPLGSSEAWRCNSSRGQCYRVYVKCCK